MSTVPGQIKLADLHYVRWFMLRTGRIVTRFQKLLYQIENGDPKAEAERDDMLERYAVTVGDNPADLCLLDYIPARNQAAAHSPRLSRALKRSALAYGRFISGIDPSHSYSASAVAMRRIGGRWTRPDLETIKESAAAIRFAATAYEGNSAELGELKKWHESTVARLGGGELGELTLREKNAYKRGQHSRLKKAFEQGVGRAIYCAIGAGAYDADIAYLHHVWAALDAEQPDDVDRDIFRLTVSGWHALRKAGYGRMRFYPGCEYDQHLEPFQRETKGLVENARAIADLLDSHAVSFSTEDKAEPPREKKEKTQADGSNRREPPERAMLKAVGALIQHHGYANDWVENHSPIKACDLTKMAGNKSPETASKLFRNIWGSHAAYKRSCAGDADDFRNKLNETLGRYKPARESFGADATNA